MLQREADEEEHNTVDQQDVENHENGEHPARSGPRDRKPPMRQNESPRDNASSKKGLLSGYAYFINVSPRSKWACPTKGGWNERRTRPLELLRITCVAV